MNKAELVSAVAEKAGFTKVDTKASVEAFLDVVSKAIADGEKVSISGFGSFEAIDVAAREGRNPQTGEVLKIDSHKRIKFKAATALKEAVNL